MHRRQLLQYAAFGSVLAALPFRVSAEADVAKQALLNSNLVYLSPVKGDGSLSSCQAEVWYVTVGTAVYVCTATSSWRSKAVRAGMTETHFWVGDRGVWRRNNYQSLPTIRLDGNVESNDDTLEAALAAFGGKYAAEWGTWGPRFRSGLADGSRTMLRYDITA